MCIAKIILVCVLVENVYGWAQITKVLPVQGTQQTEEVKPLDKFLGRLRVTYNTFFYQPGNENVKRISALRSNAEETTARSTTEDWWSDDPEDKKITFTLDESTDQVELQDEFGEPEMVTPDEPLEFHRQLVQWLGSLLALTYTAYARFSAYFCG